MKRQSLEGCFFVLFTAVALYSMTFGTKGMGEQGIKLLITVFAEAMSRVASRQRRVSQAIGDDTKADGANKSHLRNHKNKHHPSWMVFVFIPRLDKTLYK